MAVTEAENALNGVSGSAATLKRQRQLEDEQQLVASRLSGLEAKLEATEVALIEANDRLNSVSSEFVLQCMESFAEEYASGAMALIVLRDV